MTLNTSFYMLWGIHLSHGQASRQKRSIYNATHTRAACFCRQCSPPMRCKTTPHEKRGEAKHTSASLLSKGVLSPFHFHSQPPISLSANGIELRIEDINESRTVESRIPLEHHKLTVKLLESHSNSLFLQTKGLD
jgi:hypothetical protein